MALSIVLLTQTVWSITLINSEVIFSLYALQNDMNTHSSVHTLLLETRLSSLLPTSTINILPICNVNYMYVLTIKILHHNFFSSIIVSCNFSFHAHWIFNYKVFMIVVVLCTLLSGTKMHKSFLWGTYPSAGHTTTCYLFLPLNRTVSAADSLS